MQAPGQVKGHSISKRKQEHFAFMFQGRLTDSHVLKIRFLSTGGGEHISIAPGGQFSLIHRWVPGLDFSLPLPLHAIVPIYFFCTHGSTSIQVGLGTLPRYPTI